MNLRIQDGKLSPCPNSPNCVSTQAGDSRHRIQAFPFSGTVTKAKEKLLQVIESFPRTQIVFNEGNYLHIIFTSSIFRFKDDVEFYFDEGHQRVEFRSASRVGYSDLGANRKRMEKIRSLFHS